MALNLQSGEEGLSKPEIIVVQKALGITPADGDPGPLNSPTREAITEFQRGMNLRDPKTWPKIEITGLLKRGTPTRGMLLSLTPMPVRSFSSPFERAYLGDPTSSPKISRPYVGTVNEVLRLLGPWDKPLPQGDSPAAIAEKIKLMHQKIGEVRKTRPMDPDKGERLDSALYNLLKQQEPATGPDN